MNTQGNLNVERIGAMGMPFPTREEQEQIAKRVDAETAPFEAAILHLEREIALLREYRTRLVADVVTGKLDVRAVGRQLQEEAAEMEAAAPDTEELSEPEPEEVEA